MMLSGQLRDILDHLSLLWYEVALVVGALVVLTGGLISKKASVSKVLYTLSLLAALLLVTIRDQPQLILGDVLVLDSLGDIARLLFAGAAIWIVFFPGVKERTSEFYFLILAVIIGSVFMLSANHLLVIYLAVELTSFGSYIITNFNFEKRSFEAGIKYLLFGGVSSAVSLYGISLVYGFTGSLFLTELDFSLLSNPGLLNFGLVAFIGGLLFKVSIVPFHIWTPSAYEEAPTESVAILSTIPKVAGFVLLQRVFTAVEIQSVYWLLVLIEVLGIATIVIGTLGALQQTSVKRLIAYGAISHSGFLLATLLIPGESGLYAFVWYSVIYTLMNLAIFFLIAVYEQDEIVTIADYTGLGRQEAWLGALLVVVLVALIGLPPTAGFTAKFYLFSSMWKWYQDVNDPVMLTYLIVAVLSVVFSLFYYLKIPFQYFLKDTDEIRVVRSGFIPRFLATIFTAVLLWIFFSPEILNNIAENIKFIAW